MADPKETARKPAALADKMAKTVEHAVHEAAGQLLDASGNALKQGTQAAQQGAESAARFTQQQQDRTAATLGRGAAVAGDLAERGRAGVASALESGSMMAQGMQQAVQIWSEFAQESWRRQVDTTQQLLSCRSLEDAVRIQSEFVRDSLEDFAQRSRRLTRLSAEITNDAMGRAGAAQRLAAE